MMVWLSGPLFGADKGISTVEKPNCANVSTYLRGKDADCHKDDGHDAKRCPESTLAELPRDPGMG